jgi:uncharacterized membrane protein YgdD (TMEM256/DUF423 family)
MSDRTLKPIAPVRWPLVAGIVCCGLGVALGAFGAHALRSTLSARIGVDAAQGLLEVWDIAVRYQILHGLALIGLGLWQLVTGHRSRLAAAVGVLFVAGVVAFSGGLYVHVLVDLPGTAVTVPVGGLLFLAAWAGFGLLVLLNREPVR